MTREADEIETNNPEKIKPGFEIRALIYGWVSKYRDSHPDHNIKYYFF
jgi:hypothetical protein